MTDPVDLKHSPEFGLQGQVALITGATTGLGRASALALGRSGAQVIVNHLSTDDGAELVDVIRSAGGQACAIAADVSQERQVDAMFNKAIRQFGTVHILVNNAGIQDGAAFADMTLAQWQHVLDVNLTGQFLCARAAVREFIRRGPQPDLSPALGKIICMSSVHQAIPWAFEANYAASKGGVMLLMESLAQELAPQRIRVNAIAPGAVRTAINRDAWTTEEALEKLLMLIPYGRIGEPADIAQAVLWLSSDLSDYVTGSTLLVDGGMSLYPSFRGNG